MSIFLENIQIDVDLHTTTVITGEVVSQAVNHVDVDVKGFMKGRSDIEQVEQLLTGVNLESPVIGKFAMEPWAWSGRLRLTIEEQQDLNELVLRIAARIRGSANANH